MVAGTAVQQIVAYVAHQIIEVAVAAEKLIVAIVAVERVAATSARNHVVAAVADEEVAIGITRKHVVVWRSVHPFHVANRLDVAEAVVRHDAHRQIDHGALWSLEIGRAVVTCTAVNAVYTGIAVQRVVAQTTDQGVVSVVAADRGARITGDNDVAEPRAIQILHVQYRIAVTVAVDDREGIEHSATDVYGRARKICADTLARHRDSAVFGHFGVVDRVVARAAVHEVVAAAAVERVVAIEAIGPIVTGEQSEGLVRRRP